MLTSQNLTKEELRKRCREKRESLRMPRQQVSQKEHKKMIAMLGTELKKINEDPRITPKMKELYELALKTYDKTKVPSPLEMLNNVEIAREKFKLYVDALIKVCKKNNITREVFINDYLNGIYTDYFVTVLGIEIVPENIRSYIKI